MICTHRSLSVMLSLCVLACSSVSGAPARWIRDGSGRPPRLQVEQAIWAMGGLPRGGTPWTREEQVAKIAEAGFDGIMVFLPRSVEEQEAYGNLAARHGLALTLQCAPAERRDIEHAIEAAKRMGARAIVGLIQPAFVTFEDGAQKIRTMMEACRGADLPFYVETHRGTITQDILLTGRWAEAIPDISFHADLSHFVVSYDIRGKARGPVREVFDAVLSRTGMVDGRVGNGAQVQIDVGPRGESPHARRFAAWWKEAMVAWLRRAEPGEVFVFKSELGPPSYSIVDLEGREISDRWAQALVLRDLAIGTWNEAVEETGRGEVYRKGALAAQVPGGALEPLPAGLLDPQDTDFFPIHGKCFRLGDDYYLTGQLAQPDLDLAKERGIKTVVNVRMERELGGIGFDPKAHIVGLGLEYIHLPIAPETLDDALAAEFVETLAKAEKPLILLGSNGNRVWGLWALYLGARYGVPIEKTKAVAIQNGIKRLVVDEFAAGYLERLEVKK